MSTFPALRIAFNILGVCAPVVHQPALTPTVGAIIIVKPLPLSRRPSPSMFPPDATFPTFYFRLVLQGRVSLWPGGNFLFLQALYLPAGWVQRTLAFSIEGPCFEDSRSSLFLAPCRTRCEVFAETFLPSIFFSFSVPVAPPSISLLFVFSALLFQRWVRSGVIQSYLVILVPNVCQESAFTKDFCLFYRSRLLGIRAQGLRPLYS